MKPDKYNHRAREAFGKSLIDIGVSIFKGVIALFTIVPITIFVKSVLEGKKADVSVIGIFESISVGTFIALMVFILFAVLLGNFFRKEGLRHIHEIENLTRRKRKKTKTK
jgi:uncharacterized membrane protein